MVLPGQDFACHSGGMGHAGAADGLDQGFFDDAVLDVQGQFAGALLRGAPAHTGSPHPGPRPGSRRSRRRSRSRTRRCRSRIPRRRWRLPSSYSSRLRSDLTVSEVSPASVRGDVLRVGLGDILAGAVAPGDAGGHACWRGSPRGQPRWHWRPSAFRAAAVQPVIRAAVRVRARRVVMVVFFMGSHPFLSVYVVGRRVVGGGASVFVVASVYPVKIKNHIKKTDAFSFFQKSFSGLPAPGRLPLPALRLPRHG